jgi:hypothetical protein
MVARRGCLNPGNTVDPNAERAHARTHCYACLHVAEDRDMTPANDNTRGGIVPRGLRRVDAARYLGISPSHFDAQRKAGNIPAPRQMLGVVLWDRRELDSIFDGDSPSAGNDNLSDYWDKACGSENQNS